LFLGFSRIRRLWISCRLRGYEAITDGYVKRWVESNREVWDEDESDFDSYEEEVVSSLRDHFGQG